MRSLKAYWQLARFDKPIGTLLLWYPTAWALWLSNQGLPPLNVLILLILGTIAMRAAGCVANDMADRKIDKQVTRTKARPLTAGEVSLTEAFVLLGLFLVLALIVVIQLPRSCFYCALLALSLALLYPFCKRFIQAPQLVLGLAFSMGIPMAYLASSLPLDGACLLLFCINALWIIAYDTFYAMADRADDLLIGVKSTAIYFAEWDRFIIGLLQISFHSLWLLLGLYSGRGEWFYACWFFGTGFLVYQQWLAKDKSPSDCFSAFLANNYYGLCMWLALM